MEKNKNIFIICLIHMLVYEQLQDRSYIHWGTPQHLDHGLYLSHSNCWKKEKGREEEEELEN